MLSFDCMLATIWCLIGLATIAQAHQREYDFIIVGGGTAGVAVATRISQGLPDHSVLIIEAGPDGREEPGIYIPGRKGSTLGSRYDWNFTTVPQPSANNRVLPQNRGRVLGGSSALNLLSFDLGVAADYEAWEKLGNEGWNAESMYRAIRRAETYQPTAVNGSTGVNGVGHDGPIHFLVNRYSPPQQEAFFPAMQNLGLSETYGFLEGEMLGYMRHTSNILLENYTRSYSPAYLAHANTNLHLMLNTTVAKIHLERACAKGVVLDDGTLIKARKEVILSAGTIQSPQLLELSGIGNPSILRHAGIKPLIPLPGVGENLQDHARITTAYQLKPGYTSPDSLHLNTTFATSQLALWHQNKTSLYDGTSSAYAYLRWPQALPNSSALLSHARNSATQNPLDQLKLATLLDPTSRTPQLEVLFSDGYLGAKGYPSRNSTLYGAQFFTLIASILHPYTRGSTHVNTSRIASKPLFNPNYLSKPYDLHAVAAAAQFLRRVALTPPLRDLWDSEYEPGLDVVETEEQWVAYARANVASIWHPVGTCAMMPAQRGGVVSPELKVYGTRGLRVVDASVVPALVSGHIQSAVYGVAERGAEMVVREWG